MSVRLLVIERSAEGGTGKGYELVLDNDAIVLGRDPQCQVVLDKRAVSRNHARISHDDSLYFIEDLGSAFGTQVNGRPLPKNEKRLLRNGDVIAVAQFDVTFDCIAQPNLQSGGQGGASSETLARQFVKDVMRGVGGRETPSLRIMNGPKEGKRIEVPDACELVIGRDDGLDLVLKNHLISRRHAKIRRDWSGTHVEDLDSRNGIRVNRKRVTRRTLKDRDELQIGEIRLLYIDPGEAPEHSVVLDDERSEERPRRDEGGLENDDDEDPIEVTQHEPEPETEAQVEAEPEPQPEQEADGSAKREPTSEKELGSQTADAPDSSVDSDAEQNAQDAPIAPSGSEKGLFDDRRLLVVLVVMGLIALLAVGVIIAVLAGA